MSDQIYNWKRFWAPRTGHFRLDDNGYLMDPDSETGRIFNQEVVDFAKIENNSCLMLLGEPGMGKSFAMTAEIRKTINTIKGTNEKIIHLNLRSFGDESRLVKELFENPTVKGWLENVPCST